MAPQGATMGEGGGARGDEGDPLRLLRSYYQAKKLAEVAIKDDKVVFAGNRKFDRKTATAYR